MPYLACNLVRATPMLVSFPSLTTGTLLGLLVQLVTDQPTSDRTKLTEIKTKSVHGSAG
jgi:hypothetical protein